MKIVSLGSLVKIKTGKLDANANDPNGVYPFFTCSRETLKINRYSYNCECVLVAGNGDLNVKYYNGKFDAYQRTYIIESLNKQELNVKYLYYFMEQYVNKLREMSIGGVIKYIKLSYLNEAQIPLPSIKIQRKIVEVLEKSQLLIQKRKFQIEAIDKLTQSIFFKMFQPYLKEGKMQFGNFIKELRYGTSIKSGNQGVPVLRIPNIIDGLINEKDLKYCVIPDKDYEKLVLQEGDMLFVRTNGNPSYVGRCATVTKEQKGYIYASYLIRARIDNTKLNEDYISFYINSEFGRREVSRKATTSAGQYNINTKGISNINIPVPPLYLQNQFVTKLNKANQYKESLFKGLTIMEELFNSLMQRSFNGNLFTDEKVSNL